VLIKDEQGTIRLRIDREPIMVLDEYLNIGGLPFKMSEGMMAETAFWGQSQGSYETAEKMMREKRGYEISRETIRQVTDYRGKRIFEEEQRKAENLDEKLVDTRWTQEKEGILYIMMDGAFITTRERDESGSSWQENKLGLIFNSNDLHRRRVKGAGEGETHCGDRACQ
jgi:hypothetical protein